MVGNDGLKVSARNQMRGAVMQVKPGAVNTEVILALADGGTLAVTITNDSVASLALTEGMPATGLFKASSVILAVPA